ADATAGTLALRISEIAAGSGKLSRLAHELARLLVSACAADAAVFFWCRQRPPAGGRVRRSLHEVGSAFSPGRDDAMSHTRPLKASAYRALVAGRIVERAHTSAPGSGLTLALPIGAERPWAVCVLAWDAVERVPHASSELLRRLTPALVTATRPARVREETAQAYSEHQHAQRRAIFTHTSEAILSVGDDFIIQETNPAFGTVLGWQDHPPLGRRCSEVLRCRDERRMVLCDTLRCPLQQAFAAEGAAPVRELYWQTRAGKLSEVSASFSAPRTGEGGRAMIIARDITALNAINRMRANFVSMVSHEMRTSLNVVKGFLEIVAEEQAGTLNEKQVEFLGYARNGTRQLVTLVDDIMLISKADSGQFTLRLHDVDPATLIGQSLQAVHPSAQRAGVRVVCAAEPALPLLRADDTRLLQVLGNLLGNAVKYSPEDGTVRVRAQPDGDAVRFSVSDEGVGVPAADHARVFDRFYQSENASHARQGGYGLGLALAKLIVEQHGGRIWVESQEGAGATFSFTIPIAGPGPSDT
ncbi:MAG TPA: PAS domain-containing sensor histidine kinase, partial [Ktedonobacterales bacterium]|nr:PAS domain-containing sensor histidine kinase [Ktedonobacterales bacterium]